MRPFLIILIIICGFFNSVCAQSPSAAIDSLIKYRVVSIKERAVIDSGLKSRRNLSYQVAILEALDEIVLQKTFHINLHKNYSFSYSYSDGYLSKKGQDSVSKSLHLLLDKIKKSGLLTDRLYNYTLKNIDSNRYVAEVQMISILAKMSYLFEILAPDKLLPVAEQLHKGDIISDSSFSRLEADIRNEKIESTLQLNSYFDRDRELDLDKYPDDPDVWLEQVYRDISSILPGLAFTNFSYTTSPYAGSFGSPEIQYTVSLTCNGHVYKHKSFIFDFKHRKGKVRPIDFMVLDFERIFNKVLADEKSPYRLHSLMFSFQGTAGDNLEHPSFIALQEKQAEVFSKEPCMPYVLASFESYDNTLTSAKIDSSIAGWTKMGLFAHLSNSEISKAINDVAADDWYSLNGLLGDFPGVFFSGDSAVRSPKPVYKNLLNSLAIITHDEFKPTNITQRKVKGGIKLSYLAEGKIHYYTFRTANGWFDDGFPAFENNLSKENGLSGNFYPLPYENAIIYLTQQQHDYAVAHKLLDFNR